MTSVPSQTVETERQLFKNGTFMGTARIGEAADTVIEKSETVSPMVEKKQSAIIEIVSNGENIE